jgi:hypothetical protein
MHLKTSLTLLGMFFKNRVAMTNMKYFIVIMFFIIISCNKKNQNINNYNSIKQLTNKTENSEGVFLFTTNEHKIASWTSYGKDKKETNLKFAVFNENTNTFNTTKTVSRAKGLQIHAESMAKVGITKAKVLYAVFRIKDQKSRSMYGGKLYYTTSEDMGITWNKKKEFVKDTTSTSQSFFDIVQLSDGEIGISWLDKRRIHKKNTGQTLFFAKTNSENKNIINEIPLVGSVCQCCRTDIEIDNQNDITIAFRNLIEPKEDTYPSTLKDTLTEVRDMYTVVSKDNGDTFTAPKIIHKDNWQINGCPHTGPSLSSTNKNNATTWYSGKEDNEGIFFKIENQKEKFLVSKTGAHPQMVGANEKYYIVFEEYHEKDQKGYTKIVMQTWNKNELLETKEISNPETNNDHAVIKKINNQELLINWVNTDLKNARIQYRIITL